MSPVQPQAQPPQMAVVVPAAAVAATVAAAVAATVDAVPPSAAPCAPAAVAAAVVRVILFRAVSEVLVLLSTPWQTTVTSIGRNINIYDLAQAGEDVFGLSIDMMLALIQPVIEAGIEIQTDEEGGISFDLDALFLRNGTPNHDSSLFSVDDYFKERAPFSQDLFDQFLSSVEGDTATIVDVINFQIERFEDSCECNPKFFDVLDGSLLNAIASEKFSLFLLQSQPPEKFNLQAELDLKQAKIFLKYNQLPDDFVSRKEIGLDPIQFTEAFFSDMVQYTFAEICNALFALSTKCPSIVPLLTQCIPPEV